VKQLEGVVKELRAKLRQLEAAAGTKPAPSSGGGGGGGGSVDEKTLRDAVERSRAVLERKWKKGARVRAAAHERADVRGNGARQRAVGTTRAL
jgi:hypothetical protein